MTGTNRLYCIRCGRHDHIATACLAKLHINGKILTHTNNKSGSSTQSEKKGNNNNSNNNNGNISTKSSNNNNKVNMSVLCPRCGKKGHVKASCFSSVHVNGTFLG